MECDVDEKFNDDDSLGHSNEKTAISPENASSKKSGKRRRKRPRTKALRRKIREKIEVALCTNDSPIQDILKTDKDCTGASLSSIIRLLKLDTDEYRRLSCKALISIGALSKFFSIVGNSTDSLQLVLKSNGLDHSSTTVYVDNLPHSCKVDSLEKWASTFGTVVFVHPIIERKMIPNDVSTSVASDVSTSAEVSNAFNGRFFRSAFIKFVDDQSPVDFIKFHQLLRKKTASKRRKKLKLERKKAGKKNSVSTIKSNNKLQRKRQKTKKKAESSSEIQLEKVKNGEEAMEAGITCAEKPAVVVDNFNDVVRSGGGNCSRLKKRKRQPSREMDDVLIKKSKTTVDEVGDRFTAMKNAQQLTVVDTDQSSTKTFRDVGTDVPEDLLSKTDGAAKKRRRVHRQKRRNDKLRNCNLHPKKYFHDIQAYSFDTFRKLRARYLELQKQQMVQLKASLKKKSVPNTLSGLTKKEWRKKRGRCRLMMRAAKLHEEYVDLCHRIPDEDKLARCS